jgi:uncharacterized protein
MRVDGRIATAYGRRMMAPRVCVVLLAAVLLAGCAGLDARAAGERGIGVTGTGRVAVKPDTGTIEVGAEARAAQLGDATAEVDRRMREVLARVKALGVRDADIRTTTYAIDPVAEPSRQPGEAPTARIIGYHVSNVVQVRVRGVDGLGKLADAAVAGGANVVRNIQFTVDDPSRVEAEARALAVQDAAARARQVAAAAGVKLGRLLSLTDSSPVRPFPAARMTTLSAPGPVESGQLEIAVSVEARYAIEP